MIDYIHGKMISKSPTHLILESSGIGYYINIPISTYDNIADEGDVKIFTQLFIREEIITLFGFSSTEERDVFRLLITVSGIGPKIALTVLSGGAIADFKDAVVNGDLKTLASIKGIGKKTAERVILELKDSIKRVSTSSVSAGKGKKDQLHDDAVMALVSLGFKQATAEKAVDDAFKTFDVNGDIEALIRQALKST